MPLFPKTFLKTASALSLLALFVAGCATPDYKDVMAVPDNDPSAALAGARFNVGDTLAIAFTGPPDPIATQEKTIGEDGKITLADIGEVVAVGKTSSEVEKIIHDKYVPAFVNHLNVTVKAGDRVFYVRGEVGNKGRQVYVGQITVTKAITSAGDFTDFANHKNVLLIRSNGKRFIIDCDAILSGKQPDPPVYPGDQIEVRRRRW